MKRMPAPARLTVLFGLALLTANAYAHEVGNTFVYTNNNPVGLNSVSAFSVGPGGILLMVPGSPFLTGGLGSNNGQFSTQHITATVTRNFLYVANDGSNDISVFKIDTDTGRLTLVSGSPFASGGSAIVAGMSLAATPNGKFLYAGNADSANISAFRIASNGALTPIGPPIPAGGMPDGIKVSPNGKFLGVALPSSASGADLDRVAMFRISSTGALTAVPGSPFAAGGSGLAADVEINCTSNLLFDAKSTLVPGTSTVAVFTIASNGTPYPISGSPFTFIPGDDSSVGVLSPDNRHLFVSNQFSHTITSLDVAPGGSLTQETGSPFLNRGGITPVGMGTNREGTLLYVANFGNNVVTGFHIDNDGGLTPVTGSPFPTGVPGFGLESLSVFPAHEAEGEGNEVNDRGHKGHFRFQADHRCAARSEMEFDDDTGNRMNGSVDSYTVAGNTATITGSGILPDGTPVQYTAIVTGNQPVIGANLFSISWITSTGSTFQTLGVLIDGYIAVHQ